MRRLTRHRVARAAAVLCAAVGACLLAAAPAAAQSSVSLRAHSVTSTSATLVIEGHSTGWYYEDASGACTSVASGTSSVDLSGLTSGERYTFKAYSDSSCGTELTDDLTDVDLWMPGVVLNTPWLIVPEGGSYPHTVRLASEPSASVTVTVSSTGDADITADTDSVTAGSQATLTFTAANWDTPQTVTLAAAQDTDTVPQAGKGDGAYAYGSTTFTYTAASTDSVYSSLTATLTATEGDDDVCQGTTAVGGALVTTGDLVDDCNTLLAGKKRINGSGTVVDNWGTGRALSNWTAVTVTSGRITQLRLTFSFYSGADGNVPNTIADLDALTYLVMESGSAPAETGPMPDNLTSLTGLTRLSFYTRKLTGQIPSNIGDLTSLTHLDLDVNLLDGPIPDSIGSLTGLTRLAFGGNQHTGPLPASVGQLTGLTTLWAHNADLTGHFPAEIANLTAITNSSWFTLHGNRLSGCIPSSLSEFDDNNELNPQRDAAGNSVTLPLCSAGLAVWDEVPTIDEGSTADITVRLWTAPSATVTVTASVTGDADITADTDTTATGSQSTLTFTATNWSTPQTVRLSAAADADDEGGTATLTLTSSSTDASYSGLSATATVTEADSGASLSTVSVADTTATLNLSGHTSWHYRQDWPQGNDACHEASANNAQATALRASTTYRFGAYVADDCAAESLADDVSFTTTGATAPAAPTSVTVHRGYGFLDVEWPTVSGAASYDVRYSSDGGSSWTTAASAATGTAGLDSITRYRITGTQNNLVYVVSVRAKNSSGDSAWTNSPSAPSAVDPRPVWDLQSDHRGSTLAVSWDQCDLTFVGCHYGSEITGYYVHLSVDGGTTWWRAKTLAESPTDADITVTDAADRTDGVNEDRYSVVIRTGVYATSSYQVAVGVVNRMGVTWVKTGGANAPTVMGGAGKPAWVKVHRGLYFLDVDWPAITGTDRWDIVVSSDGGANWTSRADNVAVTADADGVLSYRVTGTLLPPAYIAAVRPRSMSVWSPWSESQSAPATTAVDPRPVWNLSAARSGTTLTVAWDQCDLTLVGCHYNSEITAWAINLSTDGGQTWTRAKTIAEPVDDADVTVTALNNQHNDSRFSVELSEGISAGAAYTVAVGVINRMGVTWVNTTATDS